MNKAEKSQWTNPEQHENKEDGIVTVAQYFNFENMFMSIFTQETCLFGLKSQEDKLCWNTT